MSKYQLGVPDKAKGFNYNGTDYKGGDHYETDNPCDALAFANAFQGANSNGGRKNATPNFWKDTEAACKASGGGAAGGPPAQGTTSPPVEQQPPAGGDSAAAQGPPAVDGTVGGGDADAPAPGTGKDAPNADEPTRPADGEAHGTRADEQTDQPTPGGEPVDLFSGLAFADETDLAVPNTILPLALVRGYRSGGGFYCPFGWNWDHNHNIFIRELANGDLALWRMTREERFVFDGAGFEPPRGVFEKLERLGGPGQQYDLTAAGGAMMHFERPPGWTDATRVPLLQIRDRHGNKLNYSYDARDNLAKVEDDDGHFLVFEYDSCGLVTSVTDHAGRRYSYEHDEETHHLVRVKRPATGDFPQGTTRQYHYPTGATPPSFRHNLLRIEDSEGNVYVQYSYEEDPASPNYSRVTSQLYGDYLYQFCYEQLQYVPASELNVNIPSVRAVVMNPDFSLETYTFNFRGDLLDRRYRLNKDGTYRVAVFQYEYDAQANRIRITSPDGSEERFIFDTANADPRMRGTLRRKELLAATGFPAPSRIVWRGDYEPRFQLLTRQVDEAGATTRMRYDFDLTPASPSNSGKLMQVQHPDATLPDGTIQQAVTGFEYDARGRMTAEILADGTRNEMHFGTAGAEKGRLVEEVRDAGNLAVSTRHGYDAAGYRARTTDGNGAVIESVYNALGEIERLVRPAIAGRTDEERYHYNADGHVVRVERPKGAYTGALTDAAGTHFFDLFERDVLGFATRVTLAANCAESRTTDYRNDYRGLAERTRMPDGTMLHTSFDERRQPVEERVVGVDGQELRSRNGYDRAGKLARQVDVSGRTTSFVHDGFGRVRTVALPNGTEQRRVWGERDQLLSEEVVGDDGSGAVRRLAFTEHSYDEKGRRVATITKLFESNPAVSTDHTVRFFHDALDRVTKIVDNRGGTTLRQYDGLGRTIAETDPLGNVVRSTYDAVGNLVEQQQDNVEPGGGVTTVSKRYSYDARGRRTETIEPDGATTTATYDDRDLAIEATDRIGVVTTSEYDAFNRRVRQVGDAGGLAITQQWQHDRLSRLTTYIDPTGETTHYGYDSVGRLTSRTLPGGFTTLRSYDGNSRMVKEVQPSGAELHLTYDAAGRMAGMTSAAVVAPLQPIAAHKFRYDGLDRVTKAEAGAAVVERSYDSRGRLLSETMHGATISCRYDDAAGTVEKRWPDGRTELLRHDLGGRMVSVVQTANGMLGAGNGPLASFEPSGPGLLGRAVFRGGTTLSTSFDERRRLTEIALAGPAGLSGQVRYRYDAANRRRVEAIGGAVPKTSYFAFDARRRLLLARDGFAAAVPAATTQAQHDAAIAGVEAASAAATHTENYGYDAADARISHTETGAPPNAYTYGPGHRLLNDGAQAYAHGADGALQAGGAFTYEADALGRIVAIRSGGALQLELTYDAFGRASALRPAGGAERAFHYLGGFVEQESIGGVPERQMTLQPASGVPIAWHSSAGTHFALVDARFNLLGLVDSNGALAETYRYQPFGAPQIFDAAGAPRATSAFGVRPLFGGQSWLADPGLYLAKMRLLHPALGQYLSPDPGGYADSPMLYAYAAQNPVDNIDPNGDIVFLLAALVIGGALVGAGYSIYDASEHPDKYAGLGGSLRVLGQVFGGAAIGGLAFVGGEVILGLGGTGAFATGAGVAGTGTGAASLTATQTFVLYGTSSAVSGGILRGGFNSMFPDYVDPVTPGTVAFDFATGGGFATALGKLAPGVLDASHSAQNNWVNFATDQGGQAAISGQLGPYPGKIGQLLDKIGIRQGYSSTITNLDAGGAWYARTDTGVHEGFHALVARYFPTFRDLSHTARFWGAAARYPEEVVAYALGHSGALRFHGVPLAPLEAFNSLGGYSAGQQAFAKWFWGLTYAGLTGGALTKIALDKPGADEPAHPNVKPPGAK